jgi:isoamylase
LIVGGSAETLGSEVRDGGINFAVYAPRASRLTLCLFDAAGAETQRLDLPEEAGGIWHGFVPGLEAGQRYGYRAHGAYAPWAGLRFNPEKLLLDPYARELDGTMIWDDAVFDYDLSFGTETLVASQLDSARFVPKSIARATVAEPASHHRVAMADMLIYELNVRGFTMRHPAIGEAERGRIEALKTPQILAYLQSLGITSVELMPIHAFVDEEFLIARGLHNFWGYNTVAFFAPASRYLGPAGVSGLRATVDALHAANIEVLLDVVYSHTAEGGRLGPTLGFRGLANSSYYRLAADESGEYVNDTGCGNTINADDAMTRRLIVDSLAYWTTDIGIDGFRFDLGSILGRDSHGFNREHALFEEIGSAPALRDAKLIAEPWDVGPVGYQLGNFPLCWAEWNDQYRDAVRRFWRLDPALAPAFARRVHGSADIFEPGGRAPTASVNFVASHDGFTTADLVSYSERHNEANGEDNRDGHDHNFSCSHGAEGPSDDPAIVRLRRRHRLNLLATLLLSQGTPMLLAGDEFGHSQHGNNNAYAQDNETGWLDWAGAEADPGFVAAVRGLADVRRQLPLLRQAAYRHGDPAASTGRKDIEWFDPSGGPIAEEAWAATDALGLLLSRPDAAPPQDPARAVCLLFNLREAACEFRLPPIAADGAWTARFASADEPPRIAARGVAIGGFSIACLSFA